MVRKGRYTKKRSVFYRTHTGILGYFDWFLKLSKWRKATIVAIPIGAFLLVTPLLTYAYYYNDIADKERLMNGNNTGVVLAYKTQDLCNI